VAVMSDPRFTRQTRLAEVGDDGQSRLSDVMVRVESKGARAEVETRYLRGAGVTALAAPGGDSPDPPWLASLHPAARDVAAGAHGALVVIRAILEGSPHPRVMPR